MASLYRTAAAICLAALCGLETAATQSTTYKFTAEEAIKGKSIAQSTGQLLSIITQLQRSASNFVLICSSLIVQNPSLHLLVSDAYVAINLDRNGKLPVHIKEVAGDEDLFTALKQKIEEEADGEITGNTRTPFTSNSVRIQTARGSNFCFRFPLVSLRRQQQRL
ncbi:hypothetical protein EBH_0045850 [Eimeria brunetti]|uniref:Uncharacterized protein n=1 Tax=Eimeria brunetti TaxID=51314 RepID=U6LVB4_9EIME|nr:hypothetical protein EBH_0045850 [Eimeria brunetti]